MDEPLEGQAPRHLDAGCGAVPPMTDATTAGSGAPRKSCAIAALSKSAPRLHLPEFDRLASQTRLGARARDMARMVLVEGRSMHDVALAFDTIPQRVRLAVGSIHRVQAALTWGASAAGLAGVPESLLAPLSDYVSRLGALRPGRVDHGVIAELQSLLHDARQRIAGN